MLPDLASLIALQELDTAVEVARKRLAELPAAEQAIAAKIRTAETAVESAHGRLTANAHARRELEKQVAGVDSRLSRFDDHKAAVKTNHEYTALLHEIATAKSEKDAIEEQILLTMDEADGIGNEAKAAEGALNAAKKQADAERTALGKERTDLEREIARLSAEKQSAASDVDPSVLARYEQLLKQRRMIAVAAMAPNEICTACHVRLRPMVAQKIRRNAEIVVCDSCQRILYFPAVAAVDSSAASQNPAAS